MPKKFGINSKQAEARARKETQKQEQKSKSAKDAVDKYWNDAGDGEGNRKKQEKEEKRARELARKAELRALAAKEAKELEAKKPTPKQTRYEMDLILARARQQEAAARADKERMEKAKIVPQIAVTENANQALAKAMSEEREQWGADLLEARSAGEAAEVLTRGVSGEAADRHPERRMKAAYAAFEEAQMPRLKAEHPTLKLSQLKELLFKQWKKSPDNPMNQPRE